MRLFIMLSLFLSSNLYALSCPSTGSILQEGYTVAEVIAHCGEPLSRNDEKKTTNLNEEWVYYKAHHAENTKITLSFNGGRLVNINILDTSNPNNQICQAKNRLNQTINVPCRPYEHNVSTTGFCHQIVQVGSDMNYVRSVCGNPAMRNVTASTNNDISELVYAGTKPNILVFNNGKLSDWRY